MRLLLRALFALRHRFFRLQLTLGRFLENALNWLILILRFHNHFSAFQRQLRAPEQRLSKEQFRLLNSIAQACAMLICAFLFRRKSWRKEA
jgi:uncharacterized membrane protein